MTLTDLGRRFGTWLGIEPDDPELILVDTRGNLAPGNLAPGNLAPGAAGLEPAAVRKSTPQAGTPVGSRRPAPRAISASPAFDRDVMELRRLIFELQSGLDQHHRA